MEVKIKNNGEMIDATIEMVDGVMVVSTVELFEPENGDIVTTEDGKHIFLCKDYIGEGYIYAYLGYDFNMCSWFKEGEWVAYRYATEEEKKKLFDKLAEEGYEFDFEKKTLINLKWKPEIGETYYRPNFLHCQFVCYSGTADYNKIIYVKDYINKGWMFRTKEECQEFCSRLNESISSIKP